MIKLKFRKILLTVLSIMLILSVLPLQAFAENQLVNKKVVTSITSFEDSILFQNFTIGQVGEPTLPNIITADIKTIMSDEQEVQDTGVELNVKWDGDVFSTENEKEFIYTASLVDSNILLNGVELPTITVKVVQAEQNNFSTEGNEPDIEDKAVSSPIGKSNRKIYMFGEVIPNKVNANLTVYSTYDSIINGIDVNNDGDTELYDDDVMPKLPKTVNTYLDNATIEVLPVKWSAKTHTTKTGTLVDINAPVFTEGDVIVFEAACTVYPYMDEANTKKPKFTVTLIDGTITFIKRFTPNETDLNRQDRIIPANDGTLTMPTAVLYREYGQSELADIDNRIRGLTNVSWKLKKAPSGYIISAGETADNFTIDHPAGTYTYEYILDETKYKFAPDATSTNLPIREVVWAGKDAPAPTYTVTSFKPLDTDVATQIFAVNDTVSELRKPSYVEAIATNSVTGGSETIKIPTSWGTFDSSSIGEKILKAGHLVNIGNMVYPNYEYREGLESGLTVNGFAIDINGLTLPSITVKVKDISFPPLTNLPNKEYFTKQPLGDVHDFTLEVPMSVTFQNENSKPYTDAVASLELESIKNSAGAEISLNSNKYFEAPGTYTLTYSGCKVTAKRMIWKEIWEGYQEVTTNFTTAEKITMTQVITITDAPYKDGDIIRFTDSKYNVNGDYELITIKKDDIIGFVPPSTIEVVEYDSTGINGYEKKVNKSVKWVNDSKVSYDKDTFNTSTPGTYTFTAEFTTTSSRKAPASRSMKSIKRGVTPAISTIATPVIKMPKFSITIYDLATDTIKPKFGDGSPTNPFIYYLGLGETKSLLDNSGIPVLFDRIYKADSDDSVYRDGKTNIKTILNAHGKIQGVTGDTVGSDPLVIGDNNNITTHAWVYVIDDIQAPVKLPEASDWYMPSSPSSPLPEHMIEVDKTAAWTAPGPGVDTAVITFEIKGKEVAIPRSSDIILISDASGSMVNDRHWGSVKEVFNGISDIIFEADGKNSYNNRLSVVTFGNDSSGSFNFVNNKTAYENNIANLITPTGSERTGYTAGLVQATAYAESRTGDEANRPLYVFFFTDGDGEAYYSGNHYYTANYEKTVDSCLNKLKSMNSINQAITIFHKNAFLTKFNNTEHGVDVFKAGEGLDKYYDYMEQITDSAEDLVITDVIDNRYQVIKELLPPNMELSNKFGYEVVTITVGRVEVKDIIIENIPIKLKDSSKPSDGSVVEYPTNNGAKATYENFLYEKKLIDDTPSTPDADRIGKPKLKYPSTTGPLPPVLDSFKVIYDDGVDGVDLIVPIDNNNYHEHTEVTIMTGTIPHRDGYTFLGWKDESATPVNSGNIIAAKFTMPKRHVTLTAQWDNPFKFTVTYKDGIDGQELFADDIHSGIAKGSRTPKFSGGTPSRSGYTFTGWSPTWESNVTRDMIYIAQWAKIVTPVKPEVNIPQTGDSNNLNIWLWITILSGIILLMDKYIEKKSF